MKIKRTPTIFFLFILFTTGNLFAQTNDKNFQWTSLHSIDGVEIFQKELECRVQNIPNQIAHLLKVINNSNSTVRVEWDLAIWYNDELVSHNLSDGENHYSVELAPGESVEGTCEVPSGPLYIYKDFIDLKTSTKLTRFELQNLKITQL